MLEDKPDPDQAMEPKQFRWTERRARPEQVQQILVSLAVVIDIYLYMRTMLQLPGFSLGGVHREVRQDAKRKAS